MIGSSVGSANARKALISGASTGPAAVATPARTSARNICQAADDVSEKNSSPAAPHPSPAAAAPATKRRDHVVTSACPAGNRRKRRTSSARAGETAST